MEVGDDTSPILHKDRVNDQTVIALLDTGVSIRVTSTKLFNSVKDNPKILQCNRTLRGAGGEALNPKGECFLQFKICKQPFRD